MHTESDKSVISYRELFFYLYFAIMFGMRMWGVYEGTRLYGPLLVLGLGLWGISVLMTEHSVLEYVVMVLLIALAGVAYLNSGEKGLLMYFTLMLGMKGIDVKRLFRVGIFAGGVGMICLVFLTSCGVMEEVVYLQKRPPFGTIFRHALGMPHPNTLSTSLVILSIMIMYLIGHEDRLKVWKISGILVIVTVYLFLYSCSRTGIVVNFVFLALNLLYCYRRNLGVAEKVITLILIPTIWGISILLPLVASNELIVRLMKIDYTFMSRIGHAKNYLRYNTLTLFGTRLVNPESVYGIDFAQLYLFLGYGIVAFVVVSILTLFLVVYEVKENRISEYIITVLFLIMGLSDPFLYNISFKNISFAFMGVMVYKYLAYIQVHFPSTMRYNLQIIKIGNRYLGTKFWGILNYEKNCCTYIPIEKRARLIISTTAVAALVAILFYYMTPTPEYVMTDRNVGEHKLFEELEGRTYTKQEIDDIKNRGNIVLNYTDENEFMYVYYSDENNPIEGGLYSKYGACMEKIRKSISIFFWGTILLAGIMMAVLRRVYIGNKDEQR